MYVPKETKMTVQLKREHFLSTHKTLRTVLFQLREVSPLQWNLTDLFGLAPFSFRTPLLNDILTVRSRLLSV